MADKKKKTKKEIKVRDLKPQKDAKGGEVHLYRNTSAPSGTKGSSGPRLAETNFAK
jgi:hypothetical protein